MEISKGLLIGSWILRIVVAIILLQTLFFKFTGAEESKYIFSTLMGAENEWIGRIGSGVVELLATILILYPSTTTAKLKSNPPSPLTTIPSCVK